MRRKLLNRWLGVLDKGERAILGTDMDSMRASPMLTLAKGIFLLLAISKERVRQIEVRAAGQAPWARRAAVSTLANVC